MIGPLRENLGALIQTKAESIRLCEILHLIQLIVELYDWPYFSEMRLTSLLNATMTEGPHLPLEDRTRGGESLMLYLQDSLLVVSFV